MTITRCDRCKSDIPHTLERAISLNNEGMDYDLCPTCYGALKDFLKNAKVITGGPIT